MKQAVLKKLITLVSFLLLIGNATPLFAQLVELEILGGGYKLRGPTEISFPTQTTTTSTRTGIVSFSDIGDTTPSQADFNYLMVIDENGGNPFDVTVTTTELKRNDTLQTTTLADSTATELKVSDTTGFLTGDTFVILAYEDPETIYQVASVTDGNTIVLETPFTLTPPGVGLTVNRMVDCEISPKKCIALNNLAIRNGDLVDTVYGSANDFAVNSQTTDYAAFKGATDTIDGSNGTVLYVNDATQFSDGEAITFADDSGVIPLTNTIDYIEDASTIYLMDDFVTPPAAGVTVQSSEIRSLTLGNGTGAAPGQWKIYPFLQNTLNAGQLPGTYEAILNFTIV